MSTYLLHIQYRGQHAVFVFTLCCKSPTDQTFKFKTTGLPDFQEQIIVHQPQNGRFCGKITENVRVFLEKVLS